MYDIHTHLYFESYDKDREVVLSRAKAAGIEKMIVVGCTTLESLQATELALKHPELFASIGIHPHWFNELGMKNQESGNQDRMHNSLFVIPPTIMGEIEKNIANLRSLAEHPKVIAIGECGLDYYSHDPVQRVTEEQRAFQKEGFQQQIALAEELALPLIIHTRPSAGSMDAYEDMFTILQAESSKLKACILHCYMGDTEITEKFLELSNVYFSFTGNITYPVKKTLIGSKDDLSLTVQRIPLDRILTETDCPFLSPQAHRGERNEPAYVVEVVQKIADVKDVPFGMVEATLAKSVEKIWESII